MAMADLKVHRDHFSRRRLKTLLKLKDQCSRDFRAAKLFATRAVRLNRSSGRYTQRTTPGAEFLLVAHVARLDAVETTRSETPKYLLRVYGESEHQARISVQFVQFMGLGKIKTKPSNFP